MINKKTIVKYAKEKIEANERQYVYNLIVKYANSKLTTPESKKQVSAAEKEMADAESRIVVLKAFLKEQE